MTGGPYRSLPESPERRRPDRSFLHAVKRAWRKLLLAVYGKASRRFPAKCPACGRISWDPSKVEPSIHRNAMYKVNHYRCGHPRPGPRYVLG